MTFEISPLHPDFGARITDVDVRLPLDDATTRDILAAFEEFSLLFFPGQDLAEEEQVRFCETFGEVERVKVGSIGAGTPVSALTNILPDGGLAAMDHRQSLTMKANQLWHSDGSYKESPPLASSIVAHIVPPEGGETDFMPMRSVYAALPARLRRTIEGARAVHSYATSRDSIAPGLMTEAERRALPPVEQPLVSINPVNGRKALYVGSHASHIAGLSPAEGVELVSQLKARASDSRIAYRHRWTPGDLLVWDNRSVNHRGRPWAMNRYPRLLTHTAIAARG